MLVVLPAAAQPVQERLGTVGFPVSCAAASQAPFDRGVALLHDFWYEEARAQFQRLAKSDPACAMAYWGVAMSFFHQIWDRPDGETMKLGWAETTRPNCSRTSSSGTSWPLTRVGHGLFGQVEQHHDAAGAVRGDDVRLASSADGELRYPECRRRSGPPPRAPRRQSGDHGSHRVSTGKLATNLSSPPLVSSTAPGTHAFNSDILKPTT